MRMLYKEVVKTRRHICINCGTLIMKSAFSDPYLCRNCEKTLEGGSGRDERFVYLDNH